MKMESISSTKEENDAVTANRIRKQLSLVSIKSRKEGRFLNTNFISPDQKAAF